jgi:hypothetical protein
MNGRTPATAFVEGLPTNAIQLPYALYILDKSRY